MEKPAFISSEKESNIGLDFSQLRAEGINHVQQLTGAFWTDYNEHDPGVTILEQLCYCITDLCYRTGFDVKDHFYNNRNDDTILQAHEILPCNALTINDYRKLIFDQVFELKNVWIEPIKDNGSSFEGLYKIFIDVDPSIKGEHNRNLIAEKTRKVFCNYRNLGEDIEEIKVLDPFEVDVHAEVEVDGKRDIESIMADILYRVEQYLSPEIKFYSLNEIIEEGYEVDQVFDGPLLKHGFIKTSELIPKPKYILISEIIKIIMQIQGVVSVKKLFLNVNGIKYDNQVEIPEDAIPVINKTDQILSAGNIRFFKGEVKYSSQDLNVVTRKLNELISANKRVYRLEEETLSLLPGNKKSVDQYYSIQNQFPLIYGIGQYGLPKSSDNLRKAQAKQLKGYLLLFEQILANYLSQLSNVKKLFSLKEDVGRTYFYQFLDSVPDVKPLLKEKKHEFVDEQDIFGPSYLSYYSGLEDLVKSKDNYVDRRNRFLDYLLAIHGESYTQYSLSQFNYYFNEEEFELHLIQNKSRLLKSLSSINQNRFRAFNYLEPSFGTENITGMEARIAILLGLGVSHSEELSGYKAHSLVKHYEESGLRLVENISESEEQGWSLETTRQILSHEIIDHNFDLIDTDEFSLSLVDELKSKELLGALLPFQKGVLPGWFLREGITLSKYMVGKVGEEENSSYQVLFHHDNKNLTLGDYSTEEEANLAVQSLTHFLRDLNIKSEGLHIVEHILLRPDTKDGNHGILIYDENRKPFLRSQDQYSFIERGKVIETIKSQLFDFNNYSVETTEDKEFEVHFKTNDDQHHFISLQPNLSVEETHEKMEKLYRFLSDQDKIVPLKDKIGLYIKNRHSERIIPEDFYSFRISVILPSWTARFSNKEFRSIIEDTIHENKPANIDLSCYWLSPDQLKEFETVYLEWLDNKRNPDTPKETLDMLNEQLSELLTRYKDECE